MFYIFILYAEIYIIYMLNGGDVAVSAKLLPACLAPPQRERGLRNALGQR